eukprot:12780319-Alexandrium_andersonii.AAC.1
MPSCDARAGARTVARAWGLSCWASGGLSMLSDRASHRYYSEAAGSCRVGGVLAIPFSSKATC